MEPDHEDGDDRTFRVPNVSALQERVNGIERQLRDISESVKELNRIITAAAKPNYQMWVLSGTLFCTIMAGAWGGAIALTVSPINDRVKSLESAMALMAPRELVMEKSMQTEKDEQRLQNEIDARATKDDINRLIIDLDQRFPKRH